MKYSDKNIPVYIQKDSIIEITSLLNEKDSNGVRIRNKHIAGMLYTAVLLFQNNFIFQNFLLFKEKSITNYIKEIWIKEKTIAGSTELILHDKKLTILIGSGDANILNFIFSNVLYYRVRNTTQEFLETLKLDSLLTNNSYKDIMFEYIETISLDYILLQIPDYTELHQTIKLRLLNEEFTNKQVIENFEKEGKIQEILEDYRQRTNDRIDFEITQEEEKIYRQITEIQREYDTKLTILNDIKQKAEHLKTLNNVELNITRLPKNISKIEIDEGSLILTTKPILLQIDRDKYKGIKTAKIRNYVQNPDYQFCIGTHEIIIRPGFDIKFIPKTRYKNHHIEDFSCYGTYKDHIMSAQKEQDLNKLIFLADRLLSSATIGDIAGTRTIENSLVIDQYGFIIEDLSIKYKPEEEHYLDYLRKDQVQNGHSRNIF